MPFTCTVVAPLGQSYHEHASRAKEGVGLSAAASRCGRLDHAVAGVLEHVAHYGAMRRPAHCRGRRRCGGRSTHVQVADRRRRRKGGLIDQSTAGRGDDGVAVGRGVGVDTTTLR